MNLKKMKIKKMLSKLKNISIIILNLMAVFLTIGYYNNIGAF